MNNYIKLFSVLFLLISVLFLKMSATYKVHKSETCGEKLSILEYRKHSSNEFQAILNTLCQNHIGYSEEEITAFIFHAFNELKKYIPQISLYEVALGICDVSRFYMSRGLNGQKGEAADIRIVIATYMTERKYQ